MKITGAPCIRTAPAANPPIERKESARDQRIERLAAMVETDSAFADVRAVTDDADGVAGESVE